MSGLLGRPLQAVNVGVELFAASSTGPSAGMLKPFAMRTIRSGSPRIIPPSSWYRPARTYDAIRNSFARLVWYAIAASLSFSSASHSSGGTGGWSDTSMRSRRPCRAIVRTYAPAVPWCCITSRYSKTIRRTCSMGVAGTTMSDIALPSVIASSFGCTISACGAAESAGTTRMSRHRLHPAGVRGPA